MLTRLKPNSNVYKFFSMFKAPRLQRRMFGSGPTREEQMLQDAYESAEEQPENAAAQQKLYQMLLSDYPADVVKRYESEKFAKNEDCARIYLDALVKTGNYRKLSPLVYENLDNKKSFNSVLRNLGTRSSPIYVTNVGNTLNTLRRLKDFFILGSALVLLSFYYYLQTKVEDDGKNNVLYSLMAGKEKKKPQVSNVRFSDVQGCEEAKEELKEVVEFLKDPKKFVRLGAKMPKGVLLIGPPGTGKTLLAKAVAGEADVPFFSANGSEFEEVFVGVGSSRLRSLFAQAKANSPSIVFIDEIDSLASKRTYTRSYDHQTLNQLLVELDGFTENSGVICIAATNVPETLDPALTRPGRFDKKTFVSLPDVKGRKSIFNLYLKNTKVESDVDLDTLAKATPGYSGADIANIVNFAKISASVSNKSKIAMDHLVKAKDDVSMGKERKHLVMSEEARKITAFHECGHALVNYFTNGSLPIEKISIIPRGLAMGHVAHLLDDEIFSTKESMLASLDVSMGGRAAEELVFGENKITQGASSDFQNATKMAVHMVEKYGMSQQLGHMYIDRRDRYVSEDLQALIDKEVQRLLDESKKRAAEILKTHRKQLDTLASILLEKEIIYKDEFESIMKK